MITYLQEQGMTFAEARVVELVLQGLSNDEIADVLKLSVKSVKFHLTRVFRKQGVKSRSQLMVRYLIPNPEFINIETTVSA